MDNNYFLQLEQILDEVNNKSFYLAGWGYSTDIRHDGDLDLQIFATPKGKFECYTQDSHQTFNNKEDVIDFLKKNY